jgi:plasmid stability protein
MPNLTITADEEVLRWVRIRAAEENTSVARLVGDLLRQQMRSERGYQAARRRFLSVKPRRLSQGPYPPREELHERARLR